MRAVMKALVIWIAAHPCAYASGFGWHLYLFDWSSADGALQERVAAGRNELVKDPKQLEEIQGEIDRLAMSMCETDGFSEDLSAYVREANPVQYEFYSPDTIDYLRRYNAHQLFERFSRHSARYLVASPRKTPTDPYVIFSPSELGILAEAIEKFRMKRGEASEYLNLQLAQMEASFAFGFSDRLVGASQEDTGMGAIFCGHN